MAKQDIQLPGGWKWSSDYCLSICAEISEPGGSFAFEVQGDAIEFSVKVPCGWDGATLTDYHSIPLDVLRAALDVAAKLDTPKGGA